jgi:hypothetical protein
MLQMSWQAAIQQLIDCEALRGSRALGKSIRQERWASMLFTTEATDE